MRTAAERSTAVVTALALAVTACSGSPDETAPTIAAVSTTAAAPTSPPATTSTTSTTTSTLPPTTTSTTTTTTTLPPVPPIPTVDAAAVPFDTPVEIGRSVWGTPITVVRRGDPAGVRVLVVGVIHGNEDAGAAVVDQLLVEEVPPGVELWLVRSMNPDGQGRFRGNANQVDLNRNFPVDWDFLAEPGNWQYGGTGPASEPETRALVGLGAGVRPNLVIWYHQDLFRLAPASGRKGEMRARYAEITGLPIVDITGGTYTGTAANWARTVIDGDGETITVELGETLPAADVPLHVAALFALATEFW